MQIPSSMPRLKGFRFPREVIAYAVWAYHRFALSTADVEDLLAERGVIVSREAIRLWVNRFGAHFAACFRRGRPHPNDKWHIDEVVIPINGVKHWLWWAVDANGDTLDILVKSLTPLSCLHIHRIQFAQRSVLQRLTVHIRNRPCPVTSRIKPLASIHARLR